MESLKEEKISIGPFGGPGGSVFYCTARNGFTQITIFYNEDVVNWIMFKGDTGNSSAKHGGGFNDGTRTASVSDFWFGYDIKLIYPINFLIDFVQVDIDFPSDVLNGISGTYGLHGGFVVVKSLRFYTKLNEYGPFGSESGTRFSIGRKGCCIIGVHGRCSGYIDSIGGYLKPQCTVSMPIPLIEHSQDNLMKNRFVLLRDPGPWGGEEGRGFDDGVFLKVEEIHVHLCGTGDAISGVQFKYLKKKGDVFWSPVHGARGGDIVKKVISYHIISYLLTYNEEILLNLQINFDNGGSEFVTGIEGFYGKIEMSGGVDVIRSLTFHTSKGKYGPLGCEIGKYFTSIVHDGKVVGFFGKSSAYLNAIGVHAEYS
ncbi:hypothetical protein BUALT_Bualt08G0070400 [Buddleja alternifolia]|uniref:Jacalin-type lectin domain-containing protein n=1 Tax=Buddleja alternifolia TaxID=168488 RepID=A0AAV6XBJ4_9LAMI|nr:hypothetical protein BUALT_Bualt08G0070400 [Buddleja alternifolia]